MSAALAIAGGLVVVGRAVRTAAVSVHDLDGAPLAAGFAFAGLDGLPARVDGIACDADRRILVADRGARAVRRFTLFGVEEPALARASDDGDLHGHIGSPVSVAVQGVELDWRAVVASRGTRRHALHVFDGAGHCRASLRPRGDPQATFADLARVAWVGPLVTACERASGLVSVFRGEEFHFAWRAPVPPRARGASELRAAVPVGGNRFVVALGGETASALLLVEGTGRVLATLASHGTDGGEVFEPTDVAVVPGDSDRTTRAVVLDRDGERVQVFTLTGACYGAFGDAVADDAAARATGDDTGAGTGDETGAP